MRIATGEKYTDLSQLEYIGVLAIVGSRSFKNFKKLTEYLDAHVHKIHKVVSGGAVGADRLGARWARKSKIDLQVFEPNHKKYKHAYHHRNRLIVEACSVLVAFWDGSSTGTKYTIDYALSLKKDVVVVRI